MYYFVRISCLQGILYRHNCFSLVRLQARLVLYGRSLPLRCFKPSGIKCWNILASRFWSLTQPSWINMLWSSRLLKFGYKMHFYHSCVLTPVISWPLHKHFPCLSFGFLLRLLNYGLRCPGVMHHNLWLGAKNPSIASFFFVGLKLVESLLHPPL